MINCELLMVEGFRVEKLRRLGGKKDKPPSKGVAIQNDFLNSDTIKYN